MMCLGLRSPWPRSSRECLISCGGPASSRPRSKPCEQMRASTGPGYPAGSSSGIMVQLSLDLPRRIALSRSDFLISDSNAAAFGWIDRWPNWPAGALALHGPARSGKTHLLHLWCAQTEGVIVSGEALGEAVVARLVSERRHRIAIDDADRPY